MAAGSTGSASTAIASTPSKHVNAAFWRAFVPAIQERAAARGIPQFPDLRRGHDRATWTPRRLAAHTRVDGCPRVLDFAFRRALIDTVGGSGGDRRARQPVRRRPAVPGRRAAARCSLPTFLGNHDNGRFAWSARTALPTGERRRGAEARRCSATRMLLTLRGVPTIYCRRRAGLCRARRRSGCARGHVRVAHVASYNDDTLIGTARTTATDSFDPDHPLYRADRRCSRGCAPAHPALRRGRTLLRFAGDKPGLFAVSRFDPVDRRRDADRLQHRDHAARRDRSRSRPPRPRSPTLARPLRRRPPARRAASHVACPRSATRSAQRAHDERHGPAPMPPTAPWWRGAVDLPDLSAQLRRLRTATASAICRASPRISTMSRASASMRSGCRPSSPRR